jgi:hypothetical protein
LALKDIYIINISPLRGSNYNCNSAIFTSVGVSSPYGAYPYGVHKRVVGQKTNNGRKI